MGKVQDQAAGGKPQGNRMNAMRLPVKGEGGREKGEGRRVRLVCFFGLRPEKTLFVSAEPLLTDGFTLPSSPFTLPAIASCDCLGNSKEKSP